MTLTGLGRLLSFVKPVPVAAHPRLLGSPGAGAARAVLNLIASDSVVGRELRHFSVLAIFSGKRGAFLYRVNWSRERRVKDEGKVRML